MTDKLNLQVDPNAWAGTVSPSVNLQLRDDAEPCKLFNSGKLCFTGNPAPDAKLEVNTTQNVGIGSGAVGVTQPWSVLGVYSTTGNVGIGSGSRKEQSMKIEMGGKYIRRCDREPGGQPLDGIIPVTILTNTLCSGGACYQYMGDAYVVRHDGTSAVSTKFDLLPWPEPPKLVPWDRLEDIPLDAWFSNSGAAWCKLSDVTTAIPPTHPVTIRGIWKTFLDLFDDFIWTDDPKSGIVHKCGKVAP